MEKTTTSCHKVLNFCWCAGKISFSPPDTSRHSREGIKGDREMFKCCEGTESFWKLISFLIKHFEVSEFNPLSLCGLDWIHKSSQANIFSTIRIPQPQKTLSLAIPASTYSLICLKIAVIRFDMFKLISLYFQRFYMKNFSLTLGAPLLVVFHYEMCKSVIFYCHRGTFRSWMAGTPSAFVLFKQKKKVVELKTASSFSKA